MGTLDDFRCPCCGSSDVSFEYIPDEGSAWASIYAVVAGEFIKIGLTRNSAASRMAELQTGCPLRMDLLADMRVRDKRPSTIEALVHALCEADRVGGEWFHGTEAVREVVRAMQLGPGPLAALATQRMASASS